MTLCFVPRERVLYTMIVQGGGFLPPSSCVPGVCPGEVGGRGGKCFWMKLVPA